MAVRYALLAALIFALASSLAALPVRKRRRVNPTRIRPITLTDLHFECSVQGWTQCLEVVDSLQNTSHPISSSTTECLARNNPFASTSSTPQSTTYSNAGNLVQTGGGEVRTGEAATAAPELEDCPLTMDERAIIRHDVYCTQLFLIDVVLRGMVPYLTFLRDFNCVREYPASGYLTPADIIESIKEWHKEMINSHSGCCEGENRTFSRLLDDLYNRTYFTLGERASERSCPIPHGQYWWDMNLSHVAWLVRMLELMEGLGRRRKCLRGCVSEGQVRCTNLIPLIIP